MKILPREFYERKTPEVARGLLGKLLLHRDDEGETGGIIVETEAYLGKGDPASRASKKKTKLNEIMWSRGGLAFIYMVHGKWLFNITTEKPGIPGAVLIRAIEPTIGIELMIKRRQVQNILELTSGPGKLTEAMKITKELHGVDLTLPESPLIVCEIGLKNLEICSSHRIGVKKDLQRKLRFFVCGNPYISKQKPFKRAL
ncbi:MAG: DNA-3-methyladenine glycosylase [Candidatus Hadarchaeales archaeon]